MSFEQAGDVAAKLVDRWAWWRKALANPDDIGTDSLPVHEAEPNVGYYRVRKKGEPWEPVALFYPEESDVMVAYRDGREVREIESLWVWCCRNPITYDQYEKAMKGEGFDDEPRSAPTIGHNSGEADPYDALKIEYLGEVEQINDFLKKPVKTQTDADKLAIWKDRLSKIKSRAAALHKVEKQPHLEAGRAVDDKWRDLKEEPDTVIEKVRLHVKPFFDEQKRAEEKRQQKAREEAEAARKAAEEAAAKARSQEIEQSDVEREAARLAAEEAAARAREAERAAEARKVSAGRTGARMGFRKQTVGVVTDYGKAAAALVALKHPDMIETIDKLANRAAKAGMPFDGMKVSEEEVIR